MRRREAAIPEEITFRTKPELALDLIDEVRKWGLQDRLVLADSLYGDVYEFRQGLRDRKLDYVVQVSGDLTAWTEDPHPSEPPMKQGGKIPRKRFYATDFSAVRSLCQIAKDLPVGRWKTITWREGTKGPLSSRFARVIIWMANKLLQRKTMKGPPEELLIEWPEGAKGRFRVEQDYEEMKGEVELDHF